MGLDPFTKWPTQTVAPSAGYPYGSAQDITIPGDNTGTPWVADLLNDIWGFLQQLLDASGIIPSGNPDEVDTSDYYEAMRRTAGYPGMIIPVAWNVTPVALGVRVLSLSGDGVLRASYPDLDTVVYVGDPDNPTAEAFYHADDAAGTIRNVAGVYLILPDFRGKFLRGLDLLGVIDQDGPTRDLGDSQEDAFQVHNHILGDVPASQYQYAGVFGNTGGAPNTTVIAQGPSMPIVDQQASAVEIGENINAGFTGITGIGRVRLETRPYNACVDFAIHY